LFVKSQQVSGVAKWFDGDDLPIECKRYGIGIIQKRHFSHPVFIVDKCFVLFIDELIPGYNGNRYLRCRVDIGA
jgi:hypothetical protein